MAGAQVRHLLYRSLDGLYRHDLLPIFPVLVVDQHGNGTADTLAVAHAGEYLCASFSICWRRPRPYPF